MKRAAGAFAAMASLALLPAPAQAAAKLVPAEVRYGEGPGQYGELYKGGPAMVLVLHENGQTWKAVHGEAETLARAGFTVLDLEWDKVREKAGSKIWGPLTEQIEAAVSFARDNAGSLGFDPERVAMLGGSRGANLSVLTALKMDTADPGPIKAVVSLSGDVDPVAQVDRAIAAREKGEQPDKKAENKISKTYGCERHLESCPIEYLEEWSPRDIVETGAGTPPPMLLAASEHEQTTAYFGDQEPMAAALDEHGAPSEVVFSAGGHGFGYWGEVREAAVAFLEASDGG